jgi:tRNA dimethylallyltransferase
MKESPLIVIVGETASGKSALAMELAEQYNGGIICADSRTIYKEMDIGTAKPGPAERKRVPHYCLDLVRPDERFTVADFKQHALRAIDDIAGRGKLPIMVGGTGLYIDAVLYDFQFRPPSDPVERLRLQAMTVEELQQELTDKGIPLPENSRNPRHLVRTLETGGAVSVRKELRPNTLVLGLKVERELLAERIQARVGQMVGQGFADEVRQVSQKYGWDAPALQAPGYKAFRGYISGMADLDEAKAAFVKNDLQLAKRQRTWFKRNNSVHWFDNGGNLTNFVELVTTLVNK